MCRAVSFPSEADTSDGVRQALVWVDERVSRAREQHGGREVMAWVIEGGRTPGGAGVRGVE